MQILKVKVKVILTLRQVTKARNVTGIWKFWVLAALSVTTTEVAVCDAVSFTGRVPNCTASNLSGPTVGPMSL